MIDLSKHKQGDINNPQIGDKFVFLDDGKWSDSRLYIAIVNNIYDFKETNKLRITRLRTNEDGVTYQEDLTLREAIQQCIDGDFNPPLYTKKPTKVIVCRIPIYDDKFIYFINTNNSMYKWFSVDVNSFWEAGGLLSYNDYNAKRSEHNLTIKEIEDKLLEKDEE